MIIAERLIDLRKEKRLSRKQLSIKTGFSQSVIAKWELGQSEPTASAIVKLAKFFGETADYLLGITDY